MTVAVKPNERLEQRRRECRGKGNQTDLPEIQAKGTAEQRVKSRQKGLHRIVEEMADTDRNQDLKRRALSGSEARLEMKCRNISLG